MNRTITHWMGFRLDWSSRTSPLRASATLLFGLMLVLVMGCQPQLIKGTKVRASKENLAIVQVVKQYERTVSVGNWKKLINLVSRRFRETRGTPDNVQDDYGYDGLRKKLNQFAKRKIRVLKFEVEVEKIEFVKANRAKVYVYKKYAFLYPRGKYRPGFTTGSIPQMMILEFRQGRWLFVRW